jgi:hypothetical protein
MENIEASPEAPKTPVVPATEGEQANAGFFGRNFRKVKESVTSAAGGAVELGQRLGRLGRSQVDNLYEQNSGWISEKTDQSTRMIDVGLDQVTAMANQPLLVPGSTVRFVVDQVPLLRTSVAYGEARKRFKDAQGISEEAKRQLEEHQARRECLQACLQTGIDVTTLGTSGLIDKVAKNVDRVFGMLQVLRDVQNWVVVMRTDYLSGLLDKLLEVPRINQAMHILVSWEPSQLSALENLPGTDPASESNGADRQPPADSQVVN